MRREPVSETAAGHRERRSCEPGHKRPEKIRRPVDGDHKSQFAGGAPDAPDLLPERNRALPLTMGCPTTIETSAILRDLELDQIVRVRLDNQNLVDPTIVWTREVPSRRSSGTPCRWSSKSRPCPTWDGRRSASPAGPSGRRCRGRSSTDGRRHSLSWSTSAPVFSGQRRTAERLDRPALTPPRFPESITRSRNTFALNLIDDDDS